MTPDGTGHVQLLLQHLDRLVQVDDVNGTALGRYYYDPLAVAR